jgi:hypothetical protein
MQRLVGARSRRGGSVIRSAVLERHSAARFFDKVHASKDGNDKIHIAWLVKIKDFFVLVAPDFWTHERLKSIGGRSAVARSRKLQQWVRGKTGPPSRKTRLEMYEKTQPQNEVRAFLKNIILHPTHFLAAI